MNDEPVTRDVSRNKKLARGCKQSVNNKVTRGASDDMQQCSSEVIKSDDNKTMTDQEHQIQQTRNPISKIDTMDKENTVEMSQCNSSGIDITSDTSYGRLLVDKKNKLSSVINSYEKMISVCGKDNEKIDTPSKSHDYQHVNNNREKSVSRVADLSEVTPMGKKLRKRLRSSSELMLTEDSINDSAIEQVQDTSIVANKLNYSRFRSGEGLQKRKAKRSCDENEENEYEPSTRRDSDPDPYKYMSDISSELSLNRNKRNKNVQRAAATGSSKSDEYTPTARVGASDSGFGSACTAGETSVENNSSLKICGSEKKLLYRETDVKSGRDATEQASHNKRTGAEQIVNTLRECSVRLGKQYTTSTPYVSHVVKNTDVHERKSLKFYGKDLNTLSPVQPDVVDDTEWCKPSDYTSGKVVPRKRTTRVTQKSITPVQAKPLRSSSSSSDNVFSSENSDTAEFAAGRQVNRKEKCKQFPNERKVASRTDDIKVDRVTRKKINVKQSRYKNKTELSRIKKFDFEFSSEASSQSSQESNDDFKLRVKSVKEKCKKGKPTGLQIAEPATTKYSNRRVVQTKSSSSSDEIKPVQEKGEKGKSPFNLQIEDTATTRDCGVLQTEGSGNSGENRIWKRANMGKMKECAATRTSVKRPALTLFSDDSSDDTPLHQHKGVSHESGSKRSAGKNTQRRRVKPKETKICSPQTLEREMERMKEIEDIDDNYSLNVSQ